MREFEDRKKESAAAPPAATTLQRRERSEGRTHRRGEKQIDDHMENTVESLQREGKKHPILSAHTHREFDLKFKIIRKPWVMRSDV